MWRERRRGFGTRAKEAAHHAARFSPQGRRIPTVWASGFDRESERVSAHERSVSKAQAEDSRYMESPFQAHEEKGSATWRVLPKTSAEGSRQMRGRFPKRRQRAQRARTKEKEEERKPPARGAFPLLHAYSEKLSSVTLPQLSSYLRCRCP